MIGERKTGIQRKSHRAKTRVSEIQDGGDVDVLRSPACHIYLLHYRADDTIFSDKTKFDQMVSQMDKADVAKMERPIARRKYDRKKFSRVHKKSALIPSDLADSWE